MRQSGFQWRSQTRAQATANRGPGLGRAIVRDEAVSLGSCEELIFRFSLVERPKGYPATHSPCGLVERRVAPSSLRSAEIRTDGTHVPFGAPPRAGVARDAEAEMNNRFARRRRRRGDVWQTRRIKEVAPAWLATSPR